MGPTLHEEKGEDGSASCLSTFATLAAILHVEDLDFIRIDFGDVGARATSSRNSFRMGGTDPGFDGATADKGHLKHCAVIRRRTGVESLLLGCRSLVGHRCDSTA